MSALLRQSVRKVPVNALAQSAIVKRFAPFLIIVACLIGGFILIQYLSRPERSKVPPPLALPASKGPAKLGAEPPHALGDINAAVMLEEFGDFECPPCGALHPMLKTLKSEFGASLVLVFREFPMTSLHPHAIEAARVAEAAGLQGKFWEMHELLFDNQKTWHESANPSSLFEEYAGRIGLDIDRLRRDIASPVVDQRIQLDRQRGEWIGVDGTPTLFLDGREVPFESLSVEKLRTLIKERLSQQSAAPKK